MARNRVLLQHKNTWHNWSGAAQSNSSDNSFIYVSERQLTNTQFTCKEWEVTFTPEKQRIFGLFRTYQYVLKWCYCLVVDVTSAAIVEKLSTYSRVSKCLEIHPKQRNYGKILFIHPLQHFMYASIHSAVIELRKCKDSKYPSNSRDIILILQ